MRYTTIIDISEFPSIYRNHNLRLIYMHLCLRSGYHDDDRDLIDISIRRLASDTGLSVSSVRHGLKILQASRLIKRHGTLWHVRKYILEQEITPRAKSQKEQKKKSQADAERQERDALNKKLRLQEERREALKSEGKNDFIVYYEGLVEKAKNGDIEAEKIARQRRSIYLDACRLFDRDPLDIDS